MTGKYTESASQRLIKVRENIPGGGLGFFRTCTSECQTKISKFQDRIYENRMQLKGSSDDNLTRSLREEIDDFEGAIQVYDEIGGFLSNYNENDFT